MPYDAAIIHLSDIECGPNNRADRANAGIFRSEREWYAAHTVALVTDAREQIEQTGTPLSSTGVVISGDVTSFGRPAEFALAKQVIQDTLDGLGISRRRIAVVPGNHDVSWDECKTALQEKHGDASLGDSNRVEYARKSERKLMHFKTFFEEITPGAQFRIQHPVLFEAFRELGVILVGLDSTYPCTYGHEHNFGELQADQLQKAGDILRKEREEHPSSLPMIVAHHSLFPLKRDNADTSYLKDSELTLDTLRKQGFRVVLCGHEHRRSSIENIDYQVAVFTAGTYGLVPFSVREFRVGNSF